MPLNVSNAPLAAIRSAVASKQTEITRVIVFAIIIVVIITLLGWVGNVLTRENRLCTSMNELYESKANTQLLSIPRSNWSEPLRNFYIKTAYNCCSPGNFKNSFVNTCALLNCIKQGARCLDFEIYSINSKPVIATSSVNNCTIKETYNYVSFDDAMAVIQANAFDIKTTALSTDPLFINLRLMNCPKDTIIYGAIAKSIYNRFGPPPLGRLLPSPYNREYEYCEDNECSHLSIGDVPIEILMGKVIIMVDAVDGVMLSEQPAFANSSGSSSTDPVAKTNAPTLYELTNIAGGGSPHYKIQRYSELKTISSIQSEVDYNKGSMTMILPDYASSSDNINFNLCVQLGIQFIGMSFQNFDENMEVCDLFFQKNGLKKNSKNTKPAAFILKPPSMITETVVYTTEPQNPDFSYAPRTIHSESAGVDFKL